MKYTESIHGDRKYCVIVQEKGMTKSMKKRLCALLCAATVLLAGCGEIELTDSENDMVAEYAATLLLKYSNIYSPKLQDEVIETVPEPVIPVVNPSVPTNSSDTQNPQSGQNGSTPSETAAVSTKSLSEALDIASEGFQIEYTGYEMTASYPKAENAYFIMTAANNKSLLVLKFDITNTSGEERECNVLSKQQTYRCRINENERFGSQLTMLLDDLSSYKEIFAAGETKQAVLIFQVPSEYEGTIEKLDLTIKGEDESNRYRYE